MRLVAALALVLATPLLAQSNMPPSYWAYRQLPDARQEAQAQALMQELRCLVCQGQSIADSDAELAGDMRDLVRRRIAAGEKPGEIRAWLIDRYGDWVSYRPSAAPIAWPLWAAPIVLLIFGAAMVAGRLKKETVVNGWFALILLIAASLGLFWLLRVRGGMLQLVAAGLLFGAAGYAVSGRPTLEASPRMAEQGAAPIPLTNIRHAFFGRFGPTEHWLLISESYARRGRTQDAAGVLESAVREHPGDPILWVGLGNALADHSGMLTPASELAFRRANELAPDHPAPRFFYGLALARSGDAKNAVAIWREILAKAPADAGWRPFVEDAVAALEGPRRQQPQAATGS